MINAANAILRIKVCVCARAQEREKTICRDGHGVFVFFEDFGGRRGFRRRLRDPYTGERHRARLAYCGSCRVFMVLGALFVRGEGSVIGTSSASLILARRTGAWLSTIGALCKYRLQPHQLRVQLAELEERARGLACASSVSAAASKILSAHLCARLPAQDRKSDDLSVSINCSAQAGSFIVHFAARNRLVIDGVRRPIRNADHALAGIFPEPSGTERGAYVTKDRHVRNEAFLRFITAAWWQDGPANFVSRLPRRRRRCRLIAERAECKARR